MGKRENRYGRVGSLPTLIEVLEDQCDLLTEQQKKRLKHRVKLHPHTDRNIQTAKNLLHAISHQIQSVSVDKDALFQRISAKIIEHDYPANAYSIYAEKSSLLLRFLNIFYNMRERISVRFYFIKKSFFSLINKNESVLREIRLRISEILFPKFSSAIAVFSGFLILGGLLWFLGPRLGIPLGVQKSFAVSQLSLAGSLLLGKHLFNAKNLDFTRKGDSADPNNRNELGKKEQKKFFNQIELLHHDGIIKTFSESYAMINLCGQVQMFLTADTSAAVNCPGTGIQAGLKEFRVNGGTVFFHVAPQKDGEAVVIVQPFYELRVVGTKFIVQEGKNFSRMILLDGIIDLKVKNAKNKEKNNFTVKPGTIITLYHKNQKVDEISWFMINSDASASKTVSENPHETKVNQSISAALIPFMQLPEMLNKNLSSFVQISREKGPGKSAQAGTLQVNSIGRDELTQNQFNFLFSQSVAVLSFDQLGMPATRFSMPNAEKNNNDSQVLSEKNRNRRTYVMKKNNRKVSAKTHTDKSTNNQEIDINKGLYNYQSPSDKANKTTLSSMRKVEQSNGTSHKNDRIIISDNVRNIKIVDTNKISKVSGADSIKKIDMQNMTTQKILSNTDNK